MWVDGTAIRRKLKKDYEKALRDLNRARQQIDHFNAQDLPKFARWLNSTFGALLTELRETEHKIQEHRRLLFEIEQESFASGASAGRAYARVMARRQNPRLESPLEDAESNSHANGRDQASRQYQSSDNHDFESLDEDNVDELEDILSDLFGIPRPPRRGEPKEQRTSNHGTRLKELYRALARLLHPDVQQRMTPQKLQWWHQTQEAYRKGDIDQLEVVLTLCEIDEKGTTDRTSCSLLQRITKQLKSSYRSLRAKLGQCRRDLAWGFAQRTNHYALELKVRRELDEDLFRLKEDLRSIEGILAQCARQAERRKKKPGTRRQRENYEFIF